MATGPKEDSPSQAAPPDEKETLSAAGALLSGLLLLLLQVILPALISAGTLWYLFRNFNLWHLNRTLALVLFAVGLVILSFVLCILLDAVISRMRGGARKQGSGFGSGPRTQLVKFALGSVVLPLALFGSAILVNLPTGSTAMNYVIRTSQTLEPTTLAEQIVSLVIRTPDSSTKVVGIRALESFHSPEGLSQLVRLLNDVNESLSGAGVCDALSKAIASYGLQAKAPLLDFFRKVDPSSRSRFTTLSNDPFDRYFAGSFDTLRNEVKSRTPDLADQGTELAYVDAAEEQLKRSLTALNNQQLKTENGDPRLDIVLHAFLGMKLGKDSDVLRFAKTVAADVGYSAGLRGNAILLIGKLGDKTELSVFYTYLKVDSEPLQERALEAIAELQAKKVK